MSVRLPVVLSQKFSGLWGGAFVDSSFKATGRALLACLLDSLQHGFFDLVFVKFHSNVVDF